MDTSGPSAGRTRWRCPSPAASGAGLSETARDAILGRPAGRPDRARTAMTSAAYAVRDQRCAPAWSHALWLAAAQRADRAGHPAHRRRVGPVGLGGPTG